MKNIQNISKDWYSMSWEWQLILRIDRQDEMSLQSQVNVKHTFVDICKEHKKAETFIGI